MPGIIPPSLRLDARNTECAFDLDEFPIAAIICCPRDRRCVAVNRAFGLLTGHGPDCAIDKTIVEPCDPWVPSGCRDALLRKPDGEIAATAMLQLPVIHAGERCVVCLFIERNAQSWRGAELVSAIDSVIREDMGWFGGAVMDRLARRRSSSARGAGLDDLTVRERQVLKLVCEGQDDARIAAELAISPNTLRNHLSNIYGKTGVNRRSEAVVWGRERGVMTL